MAKDRYSVAQVWLHWIIAVLILLQFLSGDAMGHFQRELSDGTARIGQSGFGANYHMVMGMAVLVLAAIRLTLRIATGVPPHTEGGPEWTHKLAHYVHIGIYYMIFLAPIFGYLAVVTQDQWAFIGHALTRVALLLLVLAHISGAIYQYFILKSDAVQRMLRFK